MTNKTKPCGRGMLRFTTVKPCRRPGQLGNANCASVRQDEAAPNSTSHTDTRVNNTSQKPPGLPTPPVQKGDKPVNLLAKYNYQANSARPGGFDELSLTQGEKLEFRKPHSVNPHWWEVKNKEGEVGYTPASYLMVLEDKISVLPWLEHKANQQPNEEDVGPSGKFGEPVIKPYVSAYADNKNKSAQFYCEVCDKQLNGPIPYKVHMNSKAHKEEVALREGFDS